MRSRVNDDRRRYLVWALAFGMIPGALALAAPPAPKQAARNAAVAPPIAIKSLRILPGPVTLAGPASRQRLAVVATFPDGSERDVTETASLTISPVGIARVDGKTQTLYPVASGAAKLIARLGGQASAVSVTVRDAGMVAPVSFVDDVVPTLSRLGCSQGGCHGAASGKGNFRLSLRGYAPEIDHNSIVKALGGRRVTLEAPEASLFLRKPLGEVPHRGGPILSKTMPEYALLLRWLREGAAGPKGDEASLSSLKLVPGDQVMRPKETRRLLVRAVYSNDRGEDVTHRAVFSVNDPAIASVDADGIVTLLRPGETAVIARYRDRVATIRLSSPYNQSVKIAVYDSSGTIDDLVNARLRKINAAPSPVCDDATFLRRAFVDVIGTLPTDDEARAFLADRTAGKRDALIDSLLARPEFGAVWALKLGDLFLLRREYMGRKNAAALQGWLTAKFNDNTPWDRLATEILTARGPVAENPGGLFFVSRAPQKDGQGYWIRATEPTAEIAAQVFLGARIGCAKCHNHPSEKYTQDDYYRFASLFRQVSGDGESDDGVPEKLAATFEPPLNHPRLGKPLDACGLDRVPMTFQKGDDRRVKAASWMVAQPDFANNLVNRLWARCFGIGIVEPVDDLRSTNPPRNPELMAHLSRRLWASGFDMKAVLREILRSKTYQRSALPTGANRFDGRQFARYYPKRLPAEELADAIGQVTNVFDRYQGLPEGARAIEIPDAEVPSIWLDTFGRPPRVAPSDSERSCEPAVSQALALLNSASVQDKLTRADGVVAAQIKAGRTDAEIVDDLFLSALARHPRPKETAALLKLVAGSKSRDEALQDVLWTLLNSDEFLFSH